MDYLINVSQAAAMLQVGVDTLRHWHVSGWLVPAVVTPGGHRRYSLDQLRQFTDRLRSGEFKRGAKLKSGPVPDQVPETQGGIILDKGEES